MQTFSFFLFYSVVWLFTLLPFRVLFFFSELFYYFVFYIVGYRKKVVFENLKNSFPEKTEEEIQEIAKKFYKHFCDLVFETFKAIHLSPPAHLKRFEFVNPKMLDKYHKKGQSVIAVFGHYANWEWMQAAPLVIPHQMVSVYKPQSNKSIDKLSNKLRSRYGNIMVSMKETYRKLVEMDSKGIPVLSLFLSDQSPARTEIQVYIPFLNHETPVIIGFEKIAKKLNHAVVYVDIMKVKRGFYKVEFIEISDNPALEPEMGLVQKFMAIMEEKIRRNPELWLWTHRRWKHKREDLEKKFNQKFKVYA
ncbi:MAG: lysophospholipid acyltransferase family protein [Bacteroidales bacterium]|nr:lysophospholipid acyltransferase family protein [Bacteroidales bacterium]